MDQDVMLLRRYAVEGCADSFRELVKRHAPMALGVARRVTGDAELAQDAAQESFFELSQHASKVEGSPAAWIHRVVVNRSIDLRRRSQARKRVEMAAAVREGGTSALADEASWREVGALVDEAIIQLQEEDRVLLIRHYIEGQSQTDIAQMKGVDRSTISRHVGRALETLRMELQKLGVQTDAAALGAALAVSAEGKQVGALVAAAGKMTMATGGKVPRVRSSLSWKTVGPMAASVAAVAALGIWLWMREIPGAPVVPAPVPAAVAAMEEEPWVPPANVTHDARPEYAGFPYLAGWPIKVEGAFSTTPTLADLKGDGSPAFIMGGLITTPTDPGSPPLPPVGMVFALDVKGDLIRGWPVVTGDQSRANLGRGGVSTPSTFRKNGKDYLVLVSADKHAIVIAPDGSIITLPGGPDTNSTLPVADINGDGIMDVLSGGGVNATVEGEPIPGWRGRLNGGYSPCVGDPLGDGNMLVYHLWYTTRNTDVANVYAYNAQGQRQGGHWPRVIDDASWHGPVMGDITGDDKAEVVGVYGQHVFAWGWDGSELPNTHDEVVAHQEGKPDQVVNGVLVSGVSGSSAPAALADLDGDGKAEIVMYDQRAHAIRAWHGDGTGFGNAEGIIAKVPKGYGVSVVSLGDEAGTMDFFCGTYWVRRKADGTTEIKNMVPGDVEIGWATQPTVVDADGDGKADVMFGVSDGRMFIYKTELAYHKEKMQWPTMLGNFQHTGSWKRASK